MPKSRRRKLNKITKQVDLSGKVANSHTKRHVKDVSRKVMYRNMLFHDASRSNSLEELKEVLKRAEDRKESDEKVKRDKPTLSYISSSLDENGVPVEAETKHIPVSNCDIERLNTVIESKEREAKALKAEE